MGLIILVDDVEIERQAFFAICTDRSIASRDECVGVPTAAALATLFREQNIQPSTVECIFVDLQLNPEQERDRGGLQAADAIREFVGDTPIIAYTRHTDIPLLADITSHEFDGILLKQDANDQPAFKEQRFRQLLAGWRKKKKLPLHAENRSAEVKEVVTPVILHISDLQFGRAYTRPRDLADAICAAVEHDRPNIVVLSGDVAQSGKPGEYADALEFLERLCSRLDIPHNERQRVIICPGNHDVNWNLSIGGYYDRDGAPLATPHAMEDWYRYRFAPYLDFCTEFYSLPGGTGSVRQANVPRAHDLRAFGLLLFSLNSSYREDFRQVGGRLDSGELDAVEKLAAGYLTERGVVCGAVFHHPLQVGVGSGTATDAIELMHDRTSVARRLWEAGVRIAFTGHVHATSVEIIPVEAGVRSDGYGLVNLLAGSAAVPEDDRPGVPGGHFANEFNVLRALVLPDEWELEVFAYDPASRAFLPKAKFPGPSPKKALRVPKARV